MQMLDRPTVVIAYGAYGVTEIEEETLRAIDARIVYSAELPAPDALVVAATADALLVTLAPVSAAVIESLECCRIISRAGTGIDGIALDAATRKGILVTNVPDYSVDEVSTHVIALLLACARRLSMALQATRHGVWDSTTLPPIARLHGQVLGVLGFGRIAQATAGKALGLGLRVISYDPYVDQNIFAASGVQPVDLETLLAISDYVSLHTPLTNRTRGIINATALDQMKPTAFLINTARGALIDETALLQALTTKRIAGAALDVLAEEPPPSDHPLVRHERVLLTPHMAWYSEEATAEVRRRAAEEIVHYFRGERPRSPVNQVPG